MQHSTMDEKTVELLEEIKKLLILAIANQGTQGRRIAEVLGVDPAVVSRILSGKRAKKK
jgi:predicted transcriptional regulator